MNAKRANMGPRDGNEGDGRHLPDRGQATAAKSVAIVWLTSGLGMRDGDGASTAGSRPGGYVASTGPETRR